MTPVGWARRWRPRCGSSGLVNETNARSADVEGDWDEVSGVVEAAFEAVARTPRGSR